MTEYAGMFGPFLDAYLKGETITVDRGLTAADSNLWRIEKGLTPNMNCLVEFRN